MIALETLVVWFFMAMFLLLPMADVAVAGLQYMSAWQALRTFGQSIQYKPPADVTNTSGWASTLPTSVDGYPISNIQVFCGGLDTVCSAGNTAAPRYYSFTTNITFAPFVVAALSGTFTLTYTERF